MWQDSGAEWPHRPEPQEDTHPASLVEVQNHQSCLLGKLEWAVPDQRQN